MTMPTIDELNEDYDWKQVFAYGGKPVLPDSRNYVSDNHSDGAVPGLCNGADCSAEPFDLNDVSEVLALSEGENDGPSWLALVQLKDGRFAYLEAGCDYTGWDCQSGGSCSLSHSLENVWRFGCTDEARARFIADERSADAVRAFGEP